MKNLFDQIPGYREAIEQEQLEREAAFLDLAETVAGIDLPPFTLAHQTALSCIGSPFICGGRVSKLDVRAFFLIVSGARGLKRWRLKLRLRKLPLETACTAIKEYLDRAEMDAPPASAISGPSYWSGPASYVDFFGSAYGWTEAQTLHVPKRRLHQYVKVQTKRGNPKATLFNPSDAKRSAWLRARRESQLKN